MAECQTVVMALAEAVRTELVAARKAPGGLTPASMASTTTLRAVLGGGDPAAAYNALKHSLLAFEGDTSVMAAAYSLGFASDGYTHLDRLTDFGTDYGYDQRQARRYSDRGVRELSFFIAEQWSMEAAPSLRLTVLQGADLELVCSTSNFHFIEMRDPVVERIDRGGLRASLPGEWMRRHEDLLVHGFAHYIFDEFDPQQETVSVLWRGEMWPTCDVSIDKSVGSPLGVHVFGARVQIRVGVPIVRNGILD